MFEEELPDSDNSDEDFVPEGEKSDLSEEESDDDIEEQEDSVNHANKTKKKAKTKRTNRKKKKNEEIIPDKIEEEKEEPKIENPVEQKKKADALWADFLKDCGPVKKKTESSDTIKPSIPSSSNLTNNKPQTSTHSKVNDLFGDFKTEKEEKVTEVYEFAGEKVIVEKKCDARKRPLGGGKGGGVAAILSQINKKTKLSTLEKSKLDWDSFKESQGINEEIAAHNRGKNGFLEKRDFLERADLRQFELEKQMREHTRSKRL